MIPELRFKKGLPDLATNSRRKRLQFFPAGAHENRRLERAY
jgi:hypothetical protein